MPGPRRPKLSDHGRLFGSDVLYEVLAELANLRAAALGDGKRSVAAVPLAETLRRSPEHVRRELEKLADLGVLEPGLKERKTQFYSAASADLADALIGLPELIIKQLGPYSRLE